MDAGTKIYAARVDHVEGNLKDLTMSMSMMHKKGANRDDDDAGGDDRDDNDDDQEGQGAKKKKKVSVQ